MQRIIGIEEFVIIWLVATTWGYLPSCQKLVADAAAPNAHALASYANITAHTSPKYLFLFSNRPILAIGSPIYVNLL